MSLFPIISNELYYDLLRPSRIIDSLPYDDLLNPGFSGDYLRPWKSVLSHVISPNAGPNLLAPNNDTFRVSLDVQQFAPHELSVKTVENSIVIEGKHEEKKDDHGYIARHFVRRYILPEGCDVKDVVSCLSSDGILTISAPSKLARENSRERIVPITHTGPAKVKPNSKK